MEQEQEVMIMAKYAAYNKKSKVVVKWLGYKNTKKEMEKLLKQYKAPKYVIPRKMTDKQLKWGG